MMPLIPTPVEPASADYPKPQPPPEQEKTLGQILFESENPFPLARSWAECHEKVKAEYEKTALPVADEAVRRATTWNEGLPPHPWDKEWFIAILNDGDKVVLRALPKEYSYDYKTSDDTYMKKEKVVKWMQFPNSNFVPYGQNKLAKQSEQIAELREALTKCRLALGQLAESPVHYYLEIADKALAKSESDKEGG